jgi:hypothetical protein
VRAGPNRPGPARTRDPMRSRDVDARLAERALREGWPVPAGRKPELIAQLIEVATSPETPPRERVSAIKVLVSVSKLNLEALRVSMAAEEFEELRARLARLEAGGGDDGPGDVAQGD